MCQNLGIVWQYTDKYRYCDRCPGLLALPFVMSAHSTCCKHCSQPRFHAGFQRWVVWQSIKPRLESVVRAKKRQPAEGIAFCSTHKGTLDHHVGHYSQPSSERHAPARGLHHASSGLQSKPCSGAAIASAGNRGRGKCRACDGNGTITKQRITKTVEKRLGDPCYLQLAVACVREIARLEGLGPKNRRSKAEIETDRHLHLHLQSEIDRWREAPTDLLLEAKVLCDRLSAIHEPVRKVVVARPIEEPE